MSQTDILDKFSAMWMMTLPGDRLSYYRTSDVAKMRESVYSVTDEIANTVGFYPVTGETELVS